MSEAASVIALLAEKREAFDRRVLAALHDGRERYSVEVAEILGLGARGFVRAGNRLRELEKQGALVSRFVTGAQCASKSGLGRRYYRAIETSAAVIGHEAAQANTDPDAAAEGSP